MGRARQLMTRILRRTGSTASVEDFATQCALGHVRKISLDTKSIASALTQEQSTESSSNPQYVSESEMSTCSMMSVNDTSSRRVGFGQVQIREYEQVVGDHPFCNSGAPLTLGWNYSDEEVESVSEHEHRKESHHARRNHDELRLSDGQRYQRLVANQVPETEIRRCLRRLHRERECSVRCALKDKAQFFCQA